MGSHPCAPQSLRAVAAGVLQGLGQQRLARRKVRVEAAMGESGLLHDVGDADPVEAGAAQRARGRVHDAVVRELLAAGCAVHRRSRLDVVSHDTPDMMSII